MAFLFFYFNATYMTITATHINLYHVCHRELWLHANEIRMEQTSDVVAEGKLIGETTYKERANRWRELAIGGIKIDHYDPAQRLVREVKKSDKLEEAHAAQVKYYLYVLEQHGLTGASGVIEYPKQRRSCAVTLTDDDRRAIPLWEDEVRRIAGSPHCPPLVKKPYCKTCSYYEFCYAQSPQTEEL